MEKYIKKSQIINEKLIKLIKQNNIKEIRKILESNDNKRGLNVGVLISDVSNIYGPYDYVDCLINYATRLGRKNCVKILLQAGARPDNVGYDNTTALMIAAQRCSTDHLECAKYLLRAGADPNYTDGYDNSALTGINLSKGPNTKKMIKLLLDAGANINHANNYGKTILMRASVFYTDILKFLLDYGLNKNIKYKLDINLKKIKIDYRGDENDYMTALMYATRSNNKESVALLLKAGADPTGALKEAKTKEIKDMLIHYIKIRPMIPLLGKNFHKKTGIPSELIRKTTEYLFSKRSFKKSYKKNKKARSS